MSGPRTEVRQVSRIVRDLTREPLSAEETALVQRELSALADEAACVAARCDACQSSADERRLKSCHVCNFVRYCGRECQRERDGLPTSWPAGCLRPTGRSFLQPSLWIRRRCFLWMGYLRACAAATRRRTRPPPTSPFCCGAATSLRKMAAPSLTKSRPRASFVSSRRPAWQRTG